MSMMFAGLTPLVSHALVTNWSWREILTIMGWALCAALAPVSLILARNAPRRNERADAGTVTPDEAAPSRPALSRPPSAATASRAPPCGKPRHAGLLGVFAVGVVLRARLVRRFHLQRGDLSRQRPASRGVLRLPVSRIRRRIAEQFSVRVAVEPVGHSPRPCDCHGHHDGGVLALPLVRTAEHAYLYAFAMALSGGVISLVFFSVWGQAFGRP